jgi:hypothetical protein
MGPGVIKMSEKVRHVAALFVGKAGCCRPCGKPDSDDVIQPRLISR